MWTEKAFVCAHNEATRVVYLTRWMNDANDSYLFKSADTTEIATENKDVARSHVEHKFSEPAKAINKHESQSLSIEHGKQMTTTQSQATNKKKI